MYSGPSLGLEVDRMFSTVRCSMPPLAASSLDKRGRLSKHSVTQWCPTPDTVPRLVSGIP